MNLRLQTPEKPLFPDMLWSKPENKNIAGKLLIIGGNSFGFAAVGEAYEQAVKAGVGEVRVLLPDAIQKFAGVVFEHALFAKTNPSGSFSKDALKSCLEAAEWADGVLVVGDVSRNAETAAMLEQFAIHYKGILTTTKDALELLLKHSNEILMRKNTNLIMTMADLQLAAKQNHFDELLNHESSIETFADRLVNFSNEIESNIIVKRQDFIFVACKEQLSLTSVNDTTKWRIAKSTKATIWHIQNPNKSFEAITTALIV